MITLFRRAIPRLRQANFELTMMNAVRSLLLRLSSGLAVYRAQ